MIILWFPLNFGQTYIQLKSRHPKNCSFGNLISSCHETVSLNRSLQNFAHRLKKAIPVKRVGKAQTSQKPVHVNRSVSNYIWKNCRRCASELLESSATSSRSSDQLKRDLFRPFRVKNHLLNLIERYISDLWRSVQAWRFAAADEEDLCVGGAPRGETQPANERKSHQGRLLFKRTLQQIYQYYSSTVTSGPCGRSHRREGKSAIP